MSFIPEAQKCCDDRQIEMMRALPVNAKCLKILFLHNEGWKKAEQEAGIAAQDSYTVNSGETPVSSVVERKSDGSPVGYAAEASYDDKRKQDKQNENCICDVCGDQGHFGDFCKRDKCKYFDIASNSDVEETALAFSSLRPAIPTTYLAPSRFWLTFLHDAAS